MRYIERVFISSNFYFKNSLLTFFPVFRDLPFIWRFGDPSKSIQRVILSGNHYVLELYHLCKWENVISLHYFKMCARICARVMRGCGNLLPRPILFSVFSCVRVCVCDCACAYTRAFSFGFEFYSFSLNRVSIIWLVCETKFTRWQGKTEDFEIEIEDGLKYSTYDFYS